MFDEESYYSFKVFELLLAESNLKEWIKENPVISTSDFLTYFLIFLRPFLENHLLSPIMKNNVLKYLNLVRFNDSKEVKKLETLSKNNKIELINSIIRLINSQNSNNYIDFYKQEIYKRTFNKKYLLLNKDMIIHYENDLLESIKYDQFILLSHSNQISDEEFKNNFLPMILNDIKYFKTIFCIISEYPNQFKNQLFVERYKLVLDSFINIQENKSGCKSIISFNNKVIKKIKSS